MYKPRSRRRSLYGRRCLRGRRSDGVHGRQGTGTGERTAGRRETNDSDGVHSGAVCVRRRSVTGAGSCIRGRERLVRIGRGTCLAAAVVAHKRVLLFFFFVAVDEISRRAGSNTRRRRRVIPPEAPPTGSAADAVIAVNP